MRAYPILVVLNVAFGIAIALSVALLLRLPSSGCRLNGVACSELGGAASAIVILVPLAMFGLFALVGVRVRRHSPRAALLLLALAPIAVAALVVGNLLGAV
jgi:hypothetical protein